MKGFNDYTFANITEKENAQIDKLEKQLKSETGKEVVLIAYQQKDTSVHA